MIEDIWCRLIDDAFYRRLPPIHVSMPNLDDRREMLRRYFLRHDSFISTENVNKLAEKLDGATFDDINRFLGQVESVNGAKLTDGAHFFKQTYSDNDTEAVWCACLQNDPLAQRKNYSDLVCAGMPITPADITNALVGTSKSPPFKPSLDAKAIEQFKTFENCGKSGVKNSQSNEHEFLPGINADVMAGKFKQRKKSVNFGFKYYSA